MTRYHVSDWLLVLYKRRWLTIGVCVVVFAYGATLSLRKTPIYESRAELLLEKGESVDASHQTEILLLRSRTLAWRALQRLGMAAPPTEADRQAMAATAARQAQGGWLVKLAQLLGAPRAIEPPPPDESSWQSMRIDHFLSGVKAVPVLNSRQIDLRYQAADPSFASRAANALAEVYREQHGGVALIDAAELPRVPVLPNHQRDLAISFAIGLALALLLTFLFEYLDSRIKTPDEIKAYLGLPFLGLIPVVPAKELRGASLLIDRGAPPDFSEAIRAVRTSVVFSSASEGGHSVMVTSTAPNEGKTVVATNLADALSQAEQRTLIIDADMRRPRVHEVFEFAQEPGLSNVLAGTADVHAAIRSTASPFLSILPAGMIPQNPAELLGSARYRQLLEDLRKEFDWIVVDAPPVMAVTDPAVISNGMSGVLFVVGAEMTPRRIAQNALDHLAAARARVIGAVLNRVNVHKHSYYYAEYYRKDYKRAYERTH